MTMGLIASIVSKVQESIEIYCHSRAGPGQHGGTDGRDAPGSAGEAALPMHKLDAWARESAREGGEQ